MKLSDFILLPQEEKIGTVLHQGVLIAKRKSALQMVFLFQLEEFYVETFCNRENKKVEEFRMFDWQHPPTPYLDAISLDGLLN